MAAMWMELEFTSSLGCFPSALMAAMPMELSSLGGFPSAGVLPRSRTLISSAGDDGDDGGDGADMLAGQLINQN